MGPGRTARSATTRGVEDKAADILALARSLVTDGSKMTEATLRKSLRKTTTKRAATASPTTKLRTTRWKSRTMQALASGQAPDLDFAAAKDELAAFDNDGQLMSVKDHCATQPPEPRALKLDPPTDVASLRRDYDARFSGLHAYGPGGATRLEELVEAALAASERAISAHKAEQRAARRNQDQSVPRNTTCAALLTASGRVHVACAVRSNTDAALSVSAERAVVLRAVADGDRKFVGLVVADANSEDLPVPDGAARQVLAEYGDFPVYLVNRNLRARRVTTHELFPLRVQPGHANARVPTGRTLPATASEALDDALSGHVERVVRDTASGEVLRGRHGATPPRRQKLKKRVASDSEASSSDGSSRSRSASGSSDGSRSRRRAASASSEESLEDSGSELEQGDRPADAMTWTVDDVAAFVLETTKAPEHAATFKRAKVNGALLMRIDAQDLEETLKIGKALDRRRLCTGLDKLRTRTHSGLARKHMPQKGGSQKLLDGYINTLDRDRVRCVARLKVAFDAQAPQKEGQDENDRALDSAQLHRAFSSLRRDLNAPHVREWFDDLKGDTSLTFLEFVDAYVALFASEDPDLKLSHGAAKALGDRVKVLASGHVQLSKSGRLPTKKKKKAELADALKKTARSASSSSSDESQGKTWKLKGDAAAAARAADETLGSVRRLAELKQKFDRFAVDDLLTGAEALQALTELGCTIPRRAAAAYFKERGAQGGPSRDVSFFEFLRAFAALELEDEPLSRGRSRSGSSGSDSSRERMDRKVKRAARKTQDKRVDDAKATARRSRRAIGRAHDSSSSRSRSPKKRRGRFQKGDAVEARPDGGDDYEGAKVSLVHDDKTYDLTFDDGRKMRRVKERKLRSLDSGSESDRRKTRKDAGSGDDRRRRERKRYERHSSDDEAGFETGDKVEAKCGGGKTRYPGKIRKVHADTTYDIDFEDGERERNVPAEHIRKAKKSKSEHTFREGDRVETKIKSKWVPGKVKRTHKDGTVDVDCSNGEKARRVDAELVRSRDGSEDGGSKPRVGDKVRAKYKGRAKEFPGLIKEAHSDGTYTIKYDDGEIETYVNKKFITVTRAKSRSRSRSDSDSDRRPKKKRSGRSRSASSSRSKNPKRGRKLREGDKVEARFRGTSSGKIFPGKVRRVNSDGTLDIAYEDGDSDKRIKEKYVKALDAGSDSDRSAKKKKRGGSRSRSRSRSRSPKRGRKLREGDKCQAHFRGSSSAKLYPGKVLKLRSDGTVDVKYSDGDTDKRLKAKYVKALDSDSDSDRSARKKKCSRSRSSKKFSEGDKVEARLSGQDKWSKAKIRRVHSDETYDLDLESGDREKRVKAKYVRKRGGSRSRSRSRSGSPRGRKLREGDKCEARFRGKSNAKYFPGKVQKVHGDGSICVKYDDGDTDARLKPSHVKALDSGSESDGSAKKEKLRAGDKIKARYRGLEKYYEGVISRVHSDGTFSIAYDDGEKESHVKEKYIKKRSSSRSRSRSRSPKRSKKPREGDKVEADFKGRGKWYMGKVKRVHSNETYDVEFEDGDSEKRVELKRIKVKGGDRSRSRSRSRSGSPKRGRKLREGSKIEARYRVPPRGITIL